VSCCIFLTMSSHTLVVCSPQRRLRILLQVAAAFAVAQDQQVRRRSSSCQRPWSARLRQVGTLPPRAYPCARASACLAGYCARSSCYVNLTAPSTCAHAPPRAPHVTLRGLCGRHLCMCLTRLCASMVLRYRCPTGCEPPPTSSTPHVKQPTAAGGRSPTLCQPLRSHIGLLASQALCALLLLRESDSPFYLCAQPLHRHLASQPCAAL